MLNAFLKFRGSMKRDTGRGALIKPQRFLMHLISTSLSSISWKERVTITKSGEQNVRRSVCCSATSMHRLDRGTPFTSLSAGSNSIFADACGDQRAFDCVSLVQRGLFVGTTTSDSNFYIRSS